MDISTVLAGHVLLAIIFHNTSNELHEGSLKGQSVYNRLSDFLVMLVFPRYLYSIMSMLVEEQKVFILEYQKVKKVYDKDGLYQSKAKELEELREAFCELSDLIFHHDKDSYRENEDDVEETLIRVMNLYNELQEEYGIEEIDEDHLSDFRKELLKRED